MLNAEYLADIDASDCDSLSDHLQYSLKGDYKYENMNNCGACAKKTTSDDRRRSDTITAVGEPSSSLFNIVRRRSSKKHNPARLWMARQRRSDRSDGDKMSRSHHAGDGNSAYDSSITSSTMMQHSFVIDPYSRRDQRLFKDYYGGDHRAKSLDNLQRFGIMSSSFCGTLDTKEKKSGGGSLGIAKSFLRRLYSTSTTKLGLNSVKDSTHSRSDEFKTAISPFFQMRLPEPEELPYLPYNIHYEVEDENDGNLGYPTGSNDDGDTYVECTLAEDLTLTCTSQQRPDGVVIPLSASHRNLSTKFPTHSRPVNFPMNKKLLRQKQMLEPRLDCGAGSTKTRPLVHGRWSNFDKGTATKNLARLTTDESVDRTLTISIKSKRGDKTEMEIGGGTSRQEDASPNDSSSLGYSTMSSSAQTINGEPTGCNPMNESICSTADYYSSPYRKAIRSSSAGPYVALRTAPRVNVGKPLNSHTIDPAWFHAAPNWPNGTEPTATFSNFDALFQFLKSEITEIQKRDEKIRRELADVELQLRGTAIQSCKFNADSD